MKNSRLSDEAGKTNELFLSGARFLPVHGCEKLRNGRFHWVLFILTFDYHPGRRYVSLSETGANLYWINAP